MTAKDSEQSKFSSAILEVHMTVSQKLHLQTNKLFTQRISEIEIDDSLENSRMEFCSRQLTPY